MRHKDDQMTPMERLGGFLTGGEMDRILAMPLICSMSGACAGMTHKEKRSSAQNEARCQVAAYERFGNDLLIVEYGLHTVGKALGTVMNDPEDAVPAIERFVLDDIDDMDRLDFSRVGLAKSEDFQRHLDCAKILVDTMGKEVPTGVLACGPFTACSSICSVEGLLKAAIKRPQSVHRLMRLCTDALKDVHEEFIKAGAMILFCEPIATGSMIDTKKYEDLVLPYTVELMENIHAHKGMVCYHICGDTKRIVASMLKAKPDMISIDNRVPLSLAKEIVGPHMPLVGNVDPVDVMIMGTPEDVDAAALRCIQDAWDSQHGYILCTGCDLNGDVPMENLEAFMAAARKYGKYPVSPANWAAA
ncbi:MAG: uroporphyrinogen decarboxylase family protein [Synergistaceae bacterium]|nr:uroporphyrinogen decarboxylase family protein [Synergistaceae bacterium]